jgi:hypothetical protein
MQAAGHGDGLSGVPSTIGAEHIRDAGGDPVRCFGLAKRQQAIGGTPGAALGSAGRNLLGQVSFASELIVCRITRHEGARKPDE